MALVAMWTKEPGGLCFMPQVIEANSDMGGRPIAQGEESFATVGEALAEAERMKRAILAARKRKEKR